MEDNLYKLWKTVKDDNLLDDLPDYDTFRSYMQDDEKFSNFHSLLRGTENDPGVMDDVPDIDEFRNIMGLKKKESPVLSEKSIQEQEEQLYFPSPEDLQSQSVFPKVNPWLEYNVESKPPVEKEKKKKGFLGVLSDVASAKTGASLTAEPGKEKPKDKPELFIFPLERRDEAFIEENGEPDIMRSLRASLDVPSRVGAVLSAQLSTSGFASFAPPHEFTPSEQDEYYKQRFLLFMAERDMQRYTEHQQAVRKEVDEFVGKKTVIDYLRNYGLQEADLPEEHDLGKMDDVMTLESFYNVYEKLPELQDRRISRLKEWGEPTALDNTSTLMSIGSSMGNMLRLFKYIGEERSERKAERYEKAGVKSPSLVDALKHSKLTDYIPVVEWLQKDEKGETLFEAGSARYADRMADIQDWLALRENPFFLEEIAGGVGSIILDAPIFFGAGAAFNAPVRAISSLKYTKNALKALGLADDVANKVVLNGYGNAIRAAHSMGGTLSGHAMVSNTLEQIGKGDIDDFSWRSMFRDAGTSYLTGFAIGGLNFGANMLADRLYAIQASKLLTDSPNAASILSRGAMEKTAVKTGAFFAEVGLFETSHAIFDPEYSLTFEGLGRGVGIIGGLRGWGALKAFPKRTAEKQRLLSLSPDEKTILGVKSPAEMRAKYKSDVEFNKLFEDKVSYPLAAKLKVAYATGRGRLVPENLVLVTDVRQEKGRIDFIGSDGSLVDVITMRGNPDAYIRSGDYKVMAEYNKNISALRDFAPEVRNNIDDMLKKGGIKEGLASRIGVAAILKPGENYTVSEMKFMRTFNDAVVSLREVAVQKSGLTAPSETVIPVPGKDPTDVGELRLEGNIFKIVDNLSVSKPLEIKTAKGADKIITDTRERIKNIDSTNPDADALKQIYNTRIRMAEHAKDLMGKEGVITRERAPEVSLKPEVRPEVVEERKPVKEAEKGLKKPVVTEEAKPKQKEYKEEITDVESGGKFTVEKDGDSFKIQSTKKVENRATKIAVNRMENRANTLLEEGRADAIAEARRVVADKGKEISVGLNKKNYSVLYRDDGSILAKNKADGKRVTSPLLLNRIKNAADVNPNSLSKKQMEVYKDRITEIEVGVRKAVEREMLEWQMGRAETLREEGRPVFGEQFPMREGQRVGGIKERKMLPSEQGKREKRLIDTWDEFKKSLAERERAFKKGVKDTKEVMRERADRLQEVIGIQDRLKEEIRKEAIDAGFKKGTKEYRQYFAEEMAKRDVYQDIPTNVLKRMTELAIDASQSDAKYRKAEAYIEKVFKDSEFRLQEKERLNVEKDIVVGSKITEGDTRRKVKGKYLVIGEDGAPINADIVRIQDLVTVGKARDFESPKERARINELDRRKDLTKQEKQELKELRATVSNRIIENPNERIEQNLKEISAIEEKLAYSKEDRTLIAGRRFVGKGLNENDVVRLDELKEQNRILNFANIQETSLPALKDMREHLNTLKSGQIVKAKAEREAMREERKAFNSRVWAGIFENTKEAKRLKEMMQEYEGLIKKIDDGGLTSQENERFKQLDSERMMLRSKLSPRTAIYKRSKLPLTIWMQQNFPSTLNIIMGESSYRGDKLPLYNDLLNERFSPKLMQASNVMFKRQNEFFTDIVKELKADLNIGIGFSRARLMNELLRASSDTKINFEIIDKNGNIMQKSLTAMQAMEKILQWGDVDGRRSMEVPYSGDRVGMGYTQKAIDNMRSQLSDKDVRIMNWMKKTWDQYSDIYDQAYIKENGVSFKKYGYNWVLNKFGNENQFTEIGEGFIDRTIRQDRTKSRLKGDTTPLKEGSALVDLFDFVNEAIRYESHAPVLREMQYTFKNGDIRNAIAVKYGTTPLKMIDDYIEIFAGNAHRSREHMMDVLVGNVARGTLGLKAAPVLKQLISSIYYAADMPEWKVAKSFISAVGSEINKKTGFKLSDANRGAISIIKDHPFTIDRLSSVAEATGQEVKDVISKLHRTDVGAKWQQRAVWPGEAIRYAQIFGTTPLKTGDIAPIMIVGGEYLAHKFKKYNRSPLTNEIANKYKAGVLDIKTKDNLDRAVNDWNFFTMLTQQSTNAMNRTYASTLGPWARAATLYTSGPLAAHRTAMYAARDANKAYKARDWNSFFKATKRFLLFHSVSGAAFSMFDNQGFIPEDSKEWRNLFLGATLGNLYGAYLLGKYVDYIKREATGVTYGGVNALNISPVLDNLDKLARSSIDLVNSMSTPVVHYPDVMNSLRRFSASGFTSLGMPVDGSIKLVRGLRGIKGAKPLTVEELQEGAELPEGRIREYGLGDPRTYGMYKETENAVEQLIPPEQLEKNLTVAGITLPIKINVGKYNNYTAMRSDFLGLVGYSRKGDIRIADAEQWELASKRAFMSGFSDQIPAFVDAAFRYRANSFFAHKYGEIKNFNQAQSIARDMEISAEELNKEFENEKTTEGRKMEIRRELSVIRSDVQKLAEIMSSWIEGIAKAAENVEKAAEKRNKKIQELLENGANVVIKDKKNPAKEDIELVKILNEHKDVDEYEGLISFGEEEGQEEEQEQEE